MKEENMNNPAGTPDNGTPESNPPDNGGKKKKDKVINTVLIAAAIVLFLLGAFFLIRQYVYIPEEYVAPPENTPVATVKPTVTLAPSEKPEPTPTPEPTPEPVHVPTTFYFTEREIKCPIEFVGQTEDGRMDTIDASDVAAWYAPGPAPGQRGNCLINGHVRWKKVAGAFSVLTDMKLGEEIAIESEDGVVQYFYVTSTDIYQFREVPDSVMDLDWGGEVRITLISCTGEWNSEAGTSNDRIIVVCEPANPEHTKKSE